MAIEARQFVCAHFDQRYVWNELNKEYDIALQVARIEGSERRPVYRRIIKPALDKLVAFIALVVASPVILACMALLAWKNRGKIWFTQLRPGKNGKLFRVIKFKTMTDERDEHGNLLPDELRLTAVGKFIRKTSLDELPQLINVLKGDMSFVGPRPLLVEYLPLYNEEQSTRHSVTPGITGWLGK